MTKYSQKLVFTIPVLVTREDDEEGKETCHIIELNPAGLLIESSNEIPNGANITVHLLKDQIKFKVISCELDESVNKYSCQLAKLDDDMNLDLYFSSFSKAAG